MSRPGLFFALVSTAAATTSFTGIMANAFAHDDKSWFLGGLVGVFVFGVSFICFALDACK